MAITAATVSVTTAATALNVQGGSQVLYLENTGATAVTIGPSTVVVGAGKSIAATTGTLTVTVFAGDVLYGISSGTTAVNVTRVGA